MINQLVRKIVRHTSFQLSFVALATLCVLIGPTEVIVRKLFYVTDTGVQDCLIHNPVTGISAVPNSVCWEKTFEESSSTKYKFNSCGERAGAECKPKGAAVYRIVLEGTSMVMGLRVPWDQTFASLLPHQLTHETGRTVELYDEGLVWHTPRNIDLRIKKVLLGTKPDMMLWALNSWDIQNASSLDPSYGKQEALPAPQNGISQRWSHLLLYSRTAAILQHFLYESPSEYVRQSLLKGEEVSFLRRDPGPVWRKQLEVFDGYFKDVVKQTSASGIPIVVTVLPQRIQASLISMREWPNGYDPFAIGDEIRDIVQKDGGIYVDVLHGFRRVPNAQMDYFPIDGHPNADGHAALSRLLTEVLISGAVPGLEAQHRRLAFSSQEAHLAKQF